MAGGRYREVSSVAKQTRTPVPGLPAAQIDPSGPLIT